ncbi:hypothetical protein [Nocardiopsis sp. NPDC006938]|uniref:hypothetical protein n=1 Tax=Nocardiopsis sp. NPDC006938 TaxID=3364337 RepID=UPI00368BA56D
MRSIGREASDEYDASPSRLRDRVAEALKNARIRGRGIRFLDFPESRVPRALRRRARELGSAVFFEPIPGEPGEYVVAAVRESGDPGSEPQFDIFGLGDAKDILGVKNDKLSTMRRRILSSHEIWGEPSRESEGGVDSGRGENKFRYREFTLERQAALEGGLKNIPSAVEERFWAGGYSNEEVRASLKSLTEMSGLLHQYARRLGVDKVREYYRIADAAFGALPRFHGDYSDIEGEVAEARSRYQEDRARVDDLVVVPNSPSGKGLKDGKGRTRRPRHRTLDENNWYWNMGERGWGEESSSDVERAVAKCYPRESSLEDMGVDSASVMRSFQDLKSPFPLRRFQGLIVPALLKSQKACHITEVSPQISGHYLVDERKNPSVRIPTGMLRTQVFENAGFALVTAQTLDELPDDGTGVPRYKTVLLGTMPLDENTRKPLGTDRILHRAEKLLLAEAERQGVAPTEIGRLENSPYLVHPSVDEKTGQIWPVSESDVDPLGAVEPAKVEDRKNAQAGRREQVQASSQNGHRGGDTAQKSSRTGDHLSRLASSASNSSGAKRPDSRGSEPGLG